jgi:transposase
MLARAAAAVADTSKLIRALIILAHVVCADETPVRAGPGPRSRKRYLLVACTRLYTYYLPGDRTLETFTAFVLPDLDGTVVVHDRYQNYEAFPGLIHQLCTAHLLRDLADAAETYPDAHWPVQIADALPGGGSQAVLLAVGLLDSCVSGRWSRRWRCCHRGARRGNPGWWRWPRR